MESPQPAGKRLRLVTRQELVRALESALAEALADEGLPAQAIARSQRDAARAFVARLRASSKRVRALSRAEFLAELEQSRALFAHERRRVEGELDALAERTGGGDGHDRVEILERRVAKLRAAFERLEGDYADLARRALADPGLPSAYREVQGQPPPARRKMLRQVLDDNLGLQQRDPA